MLVMAQPMDRSVTSPTEIMGLRIGLSEDEVVAKLAPDYHQDNNEGQMTLTFGSTITGFCTGRLNHVSRNIGSSFGAFAGFAEAISSKYGRPTADVGRIEEGSLRLNLVRLDWMRDSNVTYTVGYNEQNGELRAYEALNRPCPKPNATG